MTKRFKTSWMLVTEFWILLASANPPEADKTGMLDTGCYNKEAVGFWISPE